MLRDFLVRFDALDFVCRDSALDEAAECPSFFSALIIARERLRDVLSGCSPCSESASAFCLVLALVVSGLDCGNFTPARLALESPIAIACLADRAPCFPSHT